MDRLADLAIASLRSQVDAGASAIQLFDSWAGALERGRLRALRAAPQPPGCSPPSPTSACPASTSASTPASCSPRWPPPGPTWSASTGGCRSTSPGGASDRARPSRATSTRPSAWRRGRWSRPRCADVLAATPATRGHIFNLGHGVLPEPRPRGARPHRRPGPRRGPPAPAPAIQGEATRVSRTGARRHGLRHAEVARRRRGYYTHIRRGRPPTPEQLADLKARYDAIGGISPLAERTEAQRAALAAALDDARPGRVRGRARPEARRAVHRGRGAHAWPTRASTAPSGWCSPRTTRPSASGSTTSGPRQPEPRPASSCCPSTRWHLEPAYLDFLTAALAETRADPARPATRCCSPPTRCPSGCWSTTPTPTSSARAPPRSPSGSACCRGPTGRSPGRAPAARPSRGAAPTSSR